MKLIKAGLLDNVVGSYDQTKTTIQGRVSQKTIDSQAVLGPPLTKFNDFFTNTGIAPSGSIYKTPNNRVFLPFLAVAGTMGVAMYTHDPITNANTYVGKVHFFLPNFAATVHTIRGFKVVDDGTTGWKILISTTGAVVLNGGTFLVNKVDLTDFVAIPSSTIPFATGNDQKAVYKLTDPANLIRTSVNITVASPGKVDYIAHPFYLNEPVIFTLGTLPTGLVLNTVYYVRNPSANDFELALTSGGASIVTTGAGGTADISASYYQTSIAGISLDPVADILYVHNGVAAAHQFFVYDVATAPSYSSTTGLVINDVADTIVHPGHQFINGEPVLLTDLVGGAPFTNNTVYFVRNATTNDYQLSLTVAGAITAITIPGTVTIGRAFGVTGSNFLRKTANLPALTGTLIAADSEDYAVPGHTTNSGQPCVFFATSTNLYLGRLSDLTAGATTWGSLVTSNILGTTNQITAPTLTLASWSSVLDSAIFITNAAKFVVKKLVNNQIEFIFGELNNTYYEGFTVPESVPLGLITFGGIDFEDGVLFVSGLTIGQRGFLTIDMRSDSSYNYSYIVTPVLDTPSAILKVITSVEKLGTVTGNIKVQYRTSGFGSITGGWTTLPAFSDLDGYAAGAQIQFKILFNMQSEEFSSPAQVHELYLGIESLSEISDNWEFSDDWSDNNSPSRVAFRLKDTYVGAVPTLYFRAYDLSDALLINNNTVSNAANFEYSTNDGTTWLPLGTIPNTVGTLIRYTFSSPPGVDIRPSIKES